MMPDQVTWWTTMRTAKCGERMAAEMAVTTIWTTTRTTIMAVKMAVGMAAEGEGIKGGLGPSMYLVFLLPRLILRKPRVQSTRSYLAISSWINHSYLTLRILRSSKSAALKDPKPDWLIIWQSAINQIYLVFNFCGSITYYLTLRIPFDLPERGLEGLKEGLVNILTGVPYHPAFHPILVPAWKSYSCWFVTPGTLTFNLANP